MQVIAIPRHLNHLTVEVLVEKFNGVDLLDELMFDFSNVSFITPAGLAAVSALMRLSQNALTDQKRWFMQSKNANVSAYLERMDFFKGFGLRGPSIKRQPRQDVLLEMTHLTSVEQVEQVTEQVLRIIQAQVACGSGIISGIRTAASEVLDNVFRHSGETGGIICAQTYPRVGRVEVSVVDTGRGILKSLMENPVYAGSTSHIDAINEAVKRNTTSKPGAHTGIGLWLARQYLRANSGQLWIHSGSAQVAFYPTLRRAVACTEWPGTRIVMMWNLLCPIDTKAILDKEYPEDAVDDLFA